MNPNTRGFSQTFSKDEVPVVAQRLREMLDHYPIMTLTGPLGAGKTTLVKALLKQCGVSDTITSPTFTYVNIYKNQRGQTFYHFDCYRIKTANEFLAMGFDEYLQVPGARVLIEWPEVIRPILGAGVCEVSLDYAPDEQMRLIECVVK